MLKNLKDRFTKASDTAEYQEQYSAWKKTWHIIVPGQIIRLAEFEGQFLFPQFMRHHMSNLADGFMVAGSFNMLQMGVSSALKLPVKSRPIASSLFSTGLLTVWEKTSALPANRTFDWVDMSLHIASIGAFLAFCYKDKISKTLGVEKPPSPK